MLIVSHLQGDNKVLMTNQEEMALIYNGRDDQAMVPGEITTNNCGSGGSSSVPGPELMSYIRQMIKDGSVSSGGGTPSTRSTITKYASTKKS